MTDENVFTSSLPMIWYIVVAAACSISMVITTLLCICRKRQGKAELETPPSIKKNGDSTVSGTPSNVVGNRLSDHSNGNLYDGRVHGSSRKAIDHQRALPEIPASQMQKEESTNEFYDVISQRRPRAAEAAAARGDTPPVGNSLHHAYEIVPGIGDTPPNGLVRDPTYAGIDDQSDVDSTGYAGIPVVHPYAAVKDVKSQDVKVELLRNKNNPYATVNDSKRDKTGEEAAGDVYAQVDENRVRPPPQTTLRMESTTSYSSLPPPPVPDKRFSAELQVRTATAGGSPELPPRPPQSPRPSSISSGAAASPPLPPSGGPHGDDVTIETAATGRREPPYSRVTARESLANLRERKVDITQPFPLDVTYAQVDYSQMKTPKKLSVAQQPPADRSSLNSDLYAEIGGSQSQRSSMYARVNDVIGAVGGDVALSEASRQACTTGEPDYYSIGRQRPMSEIVSHRPARPHGNQAVAMSDNRGRTRTASSTDSGYQIIPGCETTATGFDAGVRREDGGAVTRPDADPDYDSISIPNVTSAPSDTRRQPQRIWAKAEPIYHEIDEPRDKHQKRKRKSK